MTKEEIEKNYKFGVTLKFKTAEEKEYFVGQLSDGWGENYVELDWPYEQYTDEELETGRPFHNQPCFAVELAPDEIEEMERHKKIDEELNEVS